MGLIKWSRTGTDGSDWHPKIWPHLAPMTWGYFTWETKEEGNIAIFAHIAAWMEGQYSTLRHKVVHDTKQPLLHLAGVLGPKNDHLSPGEVKIYASGRCHVVGVPVARELPSIVYSEVWSTKILQLLRCGSDAPANPTPIIGPYH